MSLATRLKAAYKGFTVNRLPGQELHGFEHPSRTGVSVTEDSALHSVAVWACVRILSETLASLPLILYRRLPKGKERAVDHPLYNLLHIQPNPEMTSFTFRETLMAHLVTWGNAYALIDWQDYTTPLAIWPMRPDMVQVKRVDNKIVYRYTLLGQGQTVELPSYQVLHIPGLGFDGLIGYSPIHMAREAIGLAMATEEFGARFFGNNAQPGLALKHPAKLTNEAAERLKKSWEEAHQGLSNAHKIAILEEGMDITKIGIPPEDAQFLETRKFQRNEIASFFHIPPHMIGDLERATFSNIEQQSLEFVIYTMRPWLVRWEQAINTKLILPNQQDYFAEFLVDGLLRGDTVSRYQSYATGRQWGWLSANDIRELENLNPIPGGEDYFMPLNMYPMGSSPVEPTANQGKSGIKAAKQGAAARHNVAQRMSKLFEDAGRKIVQKEKAGILKGIDEHLKQKAVVDFQKWLDTFYEEFSAYIKKTISGPVQEYIDAIMPLAAAEVQATTDKLPDMTSFVRKYADIFARDYVWSSKGQLQQITNVNEDAAKAVVDRLDEWEEKRPGKIAANESIACSNAIAKAVFVTAGIMKLMWVAQGGTSCPLCQELDGQIVGTEGRFGAGGLEPKSHPPIHEGCCCMITPSL